MFEQIVATMFEQIVAIIIYIIQQEY
jgi:hypothetical protein